MEDNKKRCGWAMNMFEAYVHYHDEEWGVPVYDDRKHFEFLVLESAQAGLSWSTILKKRSGYHLAFARFDPVAVASFSSEKIEALMTNPSIVRNRLKIQAAVTNAQAFCNIQSEFGSFNQYIWAFADHQVIHGHWKHQQDVPATSPLSDKLAKDMKKRGFKFLGSTILYAHLQAVGICQDHTIDCFRYAELT